MDAIDEIFGILHNGDWHRVAEVTERTRTQESKIELILSFLSMYEFVEYDKKTNRIKLSTELWNFFKKIRKVEQREASRRNNRLS